MDLLQRDFELSQLDDAVARAGAGSGLVVLVRGEAGIGKSELLRAFVEGCRNEVHLLVGACDNLLTPTPLEPFWDMADYETGIGAALQSQDTRVLFSELSDLLNRKIRPTVIVIDDIHWADQATLDVIRRVGRRIDQTHGLLVMAFRDEDTPGEHPLRTVIGDVPPRSMLRIRLGPLDRESIAQLGGHDRADELLHLTGGNPLLVTEMIRSDRDVPSSVADLVIARLNHLPEGSRSIVELVSVLPGHCDPQVAEDCLQFGPADLEVCETSGLLAVSPDRFSFRHELIRRAVADSLPETTRIELNARILTALELQGVDVSRLVHHAREAGDIDALVKYTPQAARKAASVGSRREAAAHYRTLQPHLHHYRPTEKAKLLEDWSNVEDSLGEIAQARELRMAAVKLYREAGDAVAVARCQIPLSILHWRMKRPDEAIRNAAEAIATLEHENAPAQDLAYGYAEQAFVFMLHGDDMETRSAAVSSKLAAKKAGDDESLAHGLAAELWSIEDLEEYWKKGRESVGVAEQVGSIEVARTLYTQVIQYDADIHPSKRDDILIRAFDFAEEHQLDDLRSFAFLESSMRRIDAGRFVDAEDHARIASAIWSDTDQNLALWPLSMIALSQLRRGAPQVKGTLRQVLKISDASPSVVDGIQFVIAEAHWLDPNSPFDPDTALAEHAFDIAKSGVWIFTDSALAFWLWKLGLLTEFPELLHSQCRRQIEGDWKGAAEEWAHWERPYEQAVALSDGTVDARLEALSILDDLGALPLATRIRHELREEGVRGVPSGPRSSTRDHAAGLTARQSEVLSLMGEGLTNTEIADRLFISSRTAENHVAGILSKLDAHSRDDAVAIAESMGFLQHV